MARTKRPEPIASFEVNMEDARSLVAYARSFTNHRKRRMRSELRDSVGEALKIAKNDRGTLDCLESDDLFVVFKPSANLDRYAFDDVRPLLRQALVAGCAALETYVADKAVEFISDVLAMENPPRKLREIPLSVGKWLEIDAQYERKKWGLRGVVEEHFRVTSSPAPSQIGEILSSIGVDKWERKTDNERGIKRGSTAESLARIATRRNKIAHTGDRVGQGRASLDITDVERDLAIITDVVQALEKVLASHSP